jgi:hypothetical protein
MNNTFESVLSTLSTLSTNRTATGTGARLIRQALTIGRHDLASAMEKLKQAAHTIRNSRGGNRILDIMLLAVKGVVLKWHGFKEHAQMFFRKALNSALRDETSPRTFHQELLKQIGCVQLPTTPAFAPPRTLREQLDHRHYRRTHALAA